MTDINYCNFMQLGLGEFRWVSIHGPTIRLKLKTPCLLPKHSKANLTKIALQSPIRHGGVLTLTTTTNVPTKRSLIRKKCIGASMSCQVYLWNMLEEG